MKVVVSEVTEDDLDEEEEAKGEDVTDDLHDESLGLPPNEEGANVTFPATPLNKKVVTEGWEEGPDEGEPWRLAVSRRRRRSSTDEARKEKLCALANNLNHYYYEYGTHNGGPGGIPTKRWIFGPRDAASFESWRRIHNVEEKDADSLTSEWKEYGVDETLVKILQDASWRRQCFKKHLVF